MATSYMVTINGGSADICDQGLKVDTTVTYAQMQLAAWLSKVKEQSWC